MRLASRLGPVLVSFVFATSVATLVIGAPGCGSDPENMTTIDAAPSGDGANIDAAITPDATPPPIRKMYVSTGNGQTLAVVQLESDGTMTALTNLDVDLGANTGAMAYGRATDRLYIGAGNNLVTLDLDAAGAPSIVGTPTDTGNPVFVELANNESQVVTAFFGLDSLASYDVTDDAPHNEIELLSTDDEPHAALIGPGGRVYVPHRNGGTTHWYSIALDGNMTFEGELEATAGVGPRHIAFTPDETYAYIVNEFDDSITSHTVGSDGSLTAFQTITTIPAGFDGNNNTGADIHVSPDGQFVYSSNRGHDSIAMFSVGSDGNLAPLGHADTEETPREFEVAPDSSYVVVAGQGTGFLQSYRIESDGTLTALTTGTGVGRLDVGGDPRWVIID